MARHGPDTSTALHISHAQAVHKPRLQHSLCQHTGWLPLLGCHCSAGNKQPHRPQAPTRTLGQTYIDDDAMQLCQGLALDNTPGVLLGGKGSCYCCAAQATKSYRGMQQARLRSQCSRACNTLQPVPLQATEPYAATYIMIDIRPHTLPNANTRDALGIHSLCRAAATTQNRHS
jgi:hypothetical protein